MAVSVQDFELPCWRVYLDIFGHWLSHHPSLHFGLRNLHRFVQSQALILVLCHLPIPLLLQVLSSLGARYCATCRSHCCSRYCPYIKPGTAPSPDPAAGAGTDFTAPGAAAGTAATPPRAPPRVGGGVSGAVPVPAKAPIGYITWK